MKEIRYPIGIQSFRKLREGGYLYVDKTKYIHKLVSSDNYIFLSRPRRFGKSLLLSTIEALFDGSRELFRGLAIEQTDWSWEKREVIHLDLNGNKFSDNHVLGATLDDILAQWEEKYGITKPLTTLGMRFRAVIKKAYELSGNRIVILIDEYDKPILDALQDDVVKENNRAELQAFYSVLKTMDEYIAFAMFTGVSKFSKVSVFSGMNNLQDITLEPEFNAICGVSESELDTYFTRGITEMASLLNLTDMQMKGRLKENYDGYHFCFPSDGIYNPFSLLYVLKYKNLKNYWFQTGTPSFLIEILNESNFEIPELEGCQCTESELTGSDIYLSNPLPILFQSGYLTIKGYDDEFKVYTLGYPNLEVTESFTDCLLQSYSPDVKASTFVMDFVRDVRKGDAEGFMKKIQSFLAGCSYLNVKGSPDGKDEIVGIKAKYEIHYENIMYVIMRMMGFYTQTEWHTSDGRIDMVVITNNYVYIMEFKMDGTAAEAVAQINSKEYALQFELDSRKIIKIGATFDSKTHRLADWLIE